MKDLTVAIIGAGTLGKSIITMLNKKGHEKIIATTRNSTVSNQEATEKAGVIIIATKQDSFEEIAGEIKAAREGKLLISLGPTFRNSRLNELFGPKTACLIMPAEPMEDLICYATDDDYSAEDEAVINYIFGENAVKISEEEMPIATSYVLFRGLLNDFFETLVKAGEEAGFNRQLAEKMIGRMLISAGKEIEKGESSQDRLKKASYNLDENSFTMKLHKELKPAHTLLKELFEKLTKTF